MHTLHKYGSKIFLLVFTFLFAGLYAQADETSIKIQTSDKDQSVIKFQLPEYGFVKHTRSNANYFHIDIEGYFPNLQAGAPELPVLRKLISVPADAEIDVRLSNAKYEEVALKQRGIEEKMYPHQPSQFKNESPREFVQNKEVYQADEFYGLEPVDASYLGISRDVAIARLSISPFEYNPVTNVLRVLKSAKITVEYSNVDNQKSYELTQKGASSYFNANKAGVLNAGGYKDSLTTTPAKYVIISDTMFENSLQPLVKWKTQKGFLVEEAYVSNPAVGNTSSSIRSYLQQQYNNATPNDPAPVFVLIVGDIAQVPSFQGETGSHVTDVYYGEYTGDTIPDAYVGRFSANDTAELNAQIRKTIAYEKYLMPQPSYLENAVLIAGADGNFGPSHGNGQINYINGEYVNMKNGFSPNVYLYPNSSSQETQIRQDLSDGFSIANYTAHGLSHGWSDPQLYIGDLSDVQNHGKYGLMVGNACLTNKFDDPTSFGEAVLRLDNRGAIGYIGGSNNTLWDEDFYWSVGVTGNINANPDYQSTGEASYDKLFHTQGQPYSQWHTTQAQMMFAGNLSVEASTSTNKEYYWEIYHLMGDPSLMPYLGVPDLPTASYPNALPIGVSQMQIDTDPYASVALSIDDSLIDAATSDQSGSAQLNFLPLTDTGTAMIVITSQNHQPYIDSLQIISPNGPYIAHNSVSVNDSLGNNNSKIDFGENVFLDQELKNFTSYAASNVTATLSTKDTNLTITDSVQTWSNVPGDGIVGAENAFSVQVNDLVPDQHYVSFTLEVTDDQSNTWVSYFKVKLHAPKLKLENAALSELQGNGNGIVEGGETARLEASLINQGSAEATNVSSQINSDNHLISISGSGSNNHGDLAAKGSTNIQYDIDIDHAAWKGTIFELTMQAHTSLFKEEKSKTFMVGQAMETFETADFDLFEWNHVSSSNWQIDSVDPIKGSYSARSFDGLYDNSSSELSISMEVMEEDSLSFLYLISSEKDYDFLNFYVDNKLKGQWSGQESNWKRVSFLIPKGQHTFKWSYEKDYGWSEGEDAAWIDNIIFPANDIYTSSGKQTAKSSLEVFPNPASERINIVAAERIENIEFRDVSGRVIFTQQVNDPEKTINVQNFAEGVYFLTIRMENETVENKKVIIRK
ncbi:MAG: T9SS type A sorting domain-containing protein [Bacteroidales bacterium]|nr:T9SS type A sorting domain-containing protein [Bacteroidales bacterium]MCF8327771.1 T9SS type A sorting domain-containing protein [Bacteroidales bacterium]